MAHLLHITVYLTDIADRDVFNEEYVAHVPQPVPARCCIADAALAYDGVKVEVTAHAALTRESSSHV